MRQRLSAIDISIDTPGDKFWMGRALLLVCLCLLPMVPGLAQTPVDHDRPLDGWIELPDFPSAPVQPGSILPPILPPLPDSQPSLYAGQRFLLTAVRFSGNTVISKAQLEALVAPLLNTEIDINQFQALRDRITRFYVSLGYINSGARIPDQQIDSGEVHIQITEGQLTEVDVSVDGRFRADYFSSRLQQAAQPVLNIKSLEERLVLMQQDPRIATIDAQLKPGEQPGEALMSIEVKEANALSQGIELNNHHAPSVGAEGVYYHWRHGNLNGQGETLFVGMEKTEGLSALDVLYELPMNARDDSLALFARGNRSEVIDDVFEVLDIESRSYTLGAGWRHPLKRDRHVVYDWLLSAELRNSESFLLGDGFSFSPGPENGESKLRILRTGPDLQWRSAQRVLAARATLSVGLDVFDATAHDDDRPDGEFISLLLQGQWAQRLSILQSTLITRMDMQFSNKPLLGLEQFAIGGHNTVRGYRENTLVRDQGGVASIEWRIPYVADKTTQHVVALFADAGYAKYRDRDTPGPSTINSIGIGLVGQLSANLHYRLYWAEALKDLQPLGEDDIQDDGVHFSLGTSW